jgi:hypothetical protein
MKAFYILLVSLLFGLTVADMMAMNYDAYNVAVGPKTNITIDGNPDFIFNYYLKKLTMKSMDTMFHYELHGNCYYLNAPLDTIKSGSTLSCKMGFYYDTSAIVDWSDIKLVYYGIGLDKNQYSCVDGKGTDKNSFSYQKDSAMANCMADAGASKSTLTESLGGNFQSHFMRDFDTGDFNDDNLLVPMKNVKANIMIGFEGTDNFAQQVGIIVPLDGTVMASATVTYVAFKMLMAVMIITFVL